MTLSRCEHKNFTILGNNNIGDGYCLDCKQCVSLRELLVGQFQRLQQLERRLEDKLNILEK